MISHQPSIRASFQFKLFLIFTILSFFTSCVFITLHTLDRAREDRRHARKELLLRARQLADSIRLPLYAEDRKYLGELAQRFGHVPQICRVVIRRGDGAVLAEFRPADRACAADRITERVEVVSNAESVAGLAEAASAVRIGSVEMERSTKDLKSAIHRDIAYSCLITFLFWLAVSGFSYLVLRRVTRSFDALVHGVEAMRGGDYASRIPVVCADQPGRVALAINALAESLQLRDEENRRLTADLVEAIETEVLAREELAAVNRSLAQENQERVQAEQTARESEQTLRTLMDLMPVGVLLTRPDGSVDYVNHFLVDCFGYGRDEIPTLETWFTLAFPDAGYRKEMALAQREALALSRSQGSGEGRSYDARVTCKDGSLRQVLFSNQPQGDRDIVVVIDITDRELIQEQLNKVQKLESLGVLAGGIAHNFNNALTGVMGFISLTRCSLEASHSGHKYLQRAEKASLRAAGMARQLLTFAKGGAPVKKSVSLERLVDEVVSLTLNGSNVSCQVDIPATLPPVKADEGQIVQALSNIVINAVQAMPGGGSIAIRGRCGAGACSDPAHSEEGRHVTLSISDQGHGIAEADLPKIFDPYFSTKETTGLGLASVHSIVYRHGGHISVASQLGKGTTFTICLPSAKGAPSLSREAAPAARRSGVAGGSVLVMDDDPSIRELSEKLLDFLGYHAVACADGREAVTRYRERREAGDPFLAVILDLTVPGGMGGLEAARQILKCDPQAQLIVSSGYSYHPIMAQHREHGFCAAVAKPYRANELSHELSLISERAETSPRYA